MGEQHAALSLFISYSHKDEAMRAKLETHLALLKRQNVFSVWTDRRISAGQEWAGEIDQALESARVVLLLVSADFLASNYCYDKELSRAMERHEARAARVVPIILRACDWQTAIFGKLQALPRDAFPIDRHPDGEDAAFAQVAKALRAIADELRARPFSTSPPSTCEEANALPTTSSANKATQDGQGLPPSSPTTKAPAGSAPSPAAKTKQKLKISAIKLLGLEIGPFELEWPAQFGRGTAQLALGACAVAALVALCIYQFIIRPVIADARDSMRTAAYSNAQAHLESLPKWLAWWPQRRSLLEQAQFGVRLAQGEIIKDLEPELAKLRVRHANAPDVAIFDGLLAYWKEDTTGAINQFTKAIALDPVHVEAHFLAAGRHTERARALTKKNELAAREELSKARQLLESAIQANPEAVTHKKYANQRVELMTLQGDYPGAYREYLRLSDRDALSAVLAAAMSWHLVNSANELREGAAVTRTMLAKLLALQSKPSGDASEGWKFDVGSTNGDSEVVLLDDLVDKRCFAEWVVQISDSILETHAPQLQARGGPNEGIALQGTKPAFPPVKGLPTTCENAVKRDALRNVVCSKLLSAVQALPDADPGKVVLQTWTQAHPRCNPNVRAAPVLRPIVRQPNRQEAAAT
jgi:tetratricopeptide (TPR) repeat protein